MMEDWTICLGHTNSVHTIENQINRALIPKEFQEADILLTYICLFYTHFDCLD